jgi:hypothetical protein
MLTRLDKLILSLLFVMPSLCGLGGAALLAMYGTNRLAQFLVIDWNEAFDVLFFSGLALGSASTLTVFGLLSRSLASQATQERWVECLTPNPDYDVFRGGKLGELILMVLVPLDRRGGGP